MAFPVRKSGDQGRQQIPHIHILPDFCADPDMIRHNADQLFRCDISSKTAGVKVCHHRSDTQHTVTVFNKFPDLRIHQMTVIHPGVMRVGFTDDGFIHKHGGVWQPGLTDKRLYVINQSGTCGQHARQDTGGRAVRQFCPDRGNRFSDRLCRCGKVFRYLNRLCGVIKRETHIDRTALAQRGSNQAFCLRHTVLRGHYGVGTGKALPQFTEQAEITIAQGVMHQTATLLYTTGRHADQMKNRQIFCIRTGNTVDRA